MPQEKLRFFIIDDDEALISLYTVILEGAGYEVSSSTSSVEALQQIIELQPDCVISDLLMPDLDGFALFHTIRNNKTIKQPKFIIVTGKSYEYDQRRASQIGVDGYLIKPINRKTLLKDITDLIEDKMLVEFWGCRGTLPVSGPETVRYGGNTNCVTLQISKKHYFIFDAGTGIKSLSNYLIKNKVFPLIANLFISHPHWDHINGLPFFAPFYIKGNQFDIYSIAQGDMDVERMLFYQMDSVYFPVTNREFAAKLVFHNITEGSFDIENVHVQTMLLIHPGRCLGFRLEYKNKIFCYITDNELYLEDSPYYNQFNVDRLVQFIDRADMLIIDTTYSDEEYLSKVNWGHSSVSRVVDVADKAKVKVLCLHHHDPDQIDDDIDAKLKHANELLESRHSITRCLAPVEGEKLFF